MARVRRDEFRRLPGPTALWLPDLLVLICVGMVPFSIARVLPSIDNDSLIIRGMMFAVMYGIVWRMLLRQRRFSQRVRDADGKLCTHCGYDMSGVPGATACAECGKPYEHEDARTRWADTFLVDYQK